VLSTHEETPVKVDEHEALGYRPTLLNRMGERPFRVAFFGEIGSGNTGNDGSFEVALNWVHGSVPDAEVFSICLGPEQLTARFGIPAKSMFADGRGYSRSPIVRALRRLSRQARNPIWVSRLLRDTDWVIVPGAGVLESTWHRPWMLPYSLCSLSLAARVRGARLALLNVGADRAQNGFSRWLVAQAARRADYLTVRDQHSAAVLRRLHVKVSADRVFPDLAFGLNPPAEQPPRSRWVGVGLINYFDWRGTPAERVTNRTAYEESMVSLVEWLLAEGYGVRLLTGDVWDEPCLTRVLAALRTRHPWVGPDHLVGDPARDLHDLMRQMGEVEVVIAARYHNIITALRLAKPIIALSYAPKATQAMETFGLSAFAHRIDAIDLPRLKDQFLDLYGHRADIGRRLRSTLIEVEAHLQAEREEFVDEFLLRPSPPAAPTRARLRRVRERGSTLRVL
jgi:polysaccharide pyruvyl transferase WcaK-like protein